MTVRKPLGEVCVEPFPEKGKMVWIGFLECPAVFRYLGMASGKRGLTVGSRGRKG